MKNKSLFDSPRIGIFWFLPTRNSHRFVSLARDTSRVTLNGGFKTIDEGHIDTWAKVIAADIRLSRYDYEHFPRGRVNWRGEDKSFLLLADPVVFKLAISTR